MKNKVLILIDLQQAFINKHTRDIIPRIKQLINTNNFEHIIATKFINNASSQFVKLKVYNGCMNEQDSKLIEEIDFTDTVIIERCLYTCVTNDFIKYANENKLSDFYIAGLDTDACVMKSAMDLLEQGFTPYILADYCMSSGGGKYHLDALKLLERNIGRNQVIYGEYR